MTQSNKILSVALLGLGLLAAGCPSKSKQEEQKLYDTLRFDESKRPAEEWNRNHVLFTIYLTGDKDPQRNISWPTDDYNSIKPWHKSVDFLRIKGIVFHDNLSDGFIKQYTTSNVEFVKVDGHPRFDVYTYRFLLIQDYLEKHPEIEYAYLTDGSDVVVRSNPFADIQPNLLYVGSEPQTVGATWDWLTKQVEPLLNNNPELVKSFKDAHAEKTLLNAGIVGGHREIFLEFLHETVKVSEQSAASKSKTVDMAAFNKVLLSEQFSTRFKTGLPVHSTFKSYEIDRQDVFFVHK